MDNEPQKPFLVSCDLNQDTKKTWFNMEIDSVNIPMQELLGLVLTHVAARAYAAGIAPREFYDIMTKSLAQERVEPIANSLMNPAKAN